MNSRMARQGTLGESEGTRGEFTRRALIAAAIALLAVALAAAFVLAHQVFFLLFLAILLAILLRTAGDAVARWTGMGQGWSLAAIIVLIAAAIVGAVVGLGAMAAAQLEQMIADLPRSLDQAVSRVRQYEWGRQLLGNAPPQQILSQSLGSVASSMNTFFSATLGVLGNLLVLVFLTTYLAASPRMYVSGILLLVPEPRRPRARQVLDAIAFHLRWWLVGRLVAVVTVGVLTGIGLWIAGVPQFLVLGLIAAALTLIPYIGPIVAAIPGVLLALLQGPTTALWALAVYLLAQSVENYLVTPLVQQSTVQMPPVLTILSLVLAGSLFGMLGLIVATPLAVAILVAVKMLYVEDALGEQLNVPS